MQAKGWTLIKVKTFGGTPTAIIKHTDGTVARISLAAWERQK